MAIQGRNLIVSLDGTAIAMAKNCTFTHECDLHEVSSPGASDYKTFIKERRSWKVTAGYLCGDVKTGLMKVGSTVTLTFGLRNSVSDRVSGTAICTKCQIVGTVGNLASGSFEFTGSGALT